MKPYILIFFFSISLFSHAQLEQKPTLEAKGDMILATYFHDNGSIQQQGTFSKEGALNGLWTSYDNEGNKLSQGYYENGIKSGKWFFWSEDTLKEVDFQDSKITNVIEWDEKSEVAVNY